MTPLPITGILKANDTNNKTAKAEANPTDSSRELADVSTTRVYIIILRYNHCLYVDNVKLLAFPELFFSIDMRTQEVDALLVCVESVVEFAEAMPLIVVDSDFCWLPEFLKLCLA